MADKRAGAVSRTCRRCKAGDRQQLDDGRVARHRRAEGHCRPRRRDKLVAAIKKIVDSKDYKDFMAQRGFGVTAWAPERVRQRSWPRPTPTWARR